MAYNRKDPQFISFHVAVYLPHLSVGVNNTAILYGFPGSDLQQKHTCSRHMSQPSAPIERLPGSPSHVGNSWLIYLCRMRDMKGATALRSKGCRWCIVFITIENVWKLTVPPCAYAVLFVTERVVGLIRPSCHANATATASECNAHTGHLTWPLYNGVFAAVAFEIIDSNVHQINCISLVEKFEWSFAGFTDGKYDLVIFCRNT